MRDAFIAAITSAAEQDKDVVLVTGDLGFGVFEEFAKKFPRQFINAGVAEQSMMSMAAGMASTGKKVFAYSIGNFSTLRCLEQIRNDVCYQDNPVTIVSVGGGYAYGNLGYSHHALEDFSVMRTLPRLEILSPADQLEVKELVKIILNDPKPYYLRLGRNGEAPLHEVGVEITPGKFLEITSGHSGAILFTGSIGRLAVDARKILMSRSIEVALYSVPFLNRIDAAKLKSICNQGKILTLEEHYYKGGLGSEILETLNQMQITQQLRILGSTREDTNLIGDRDYLLSKNGLSVERITSYFEEN